MVNDEQLQMKGDDTMSNKKVNKDKSIVREDQLTYDDYALIDDEKRYELVSGKLELMSPAPSTIHQLISSEVFKQLSLTCETDFLIFFAPIDVILSPKDVRQPDIVLVSRNRMEVISQRGIEGPPDLVIEVISPSSVKRDKIDKLATYAQFDIPEYWMVDPRMETLEQYILKNDRYELVNLFQDDETILSPHISCIAFTMNTVMENIPDINH